eukprot:325551-Rhodomonas_salina.1
MCKEAIVCSGVPPFFLVPRCASSCVCSRKSPSLYSGTSTARWAYCGTEAVPDSRLEPQLVSTGNPVGWYLLCPDVRANLVAEYTASRAVYRRGGERARPAQCTRRLVIPYHLRSRPYPRQYQRVLQQHCTRFVIGRQVGQYPALLPVADDQQRHFVLGGQVLVAPHALSVQAVRS